MGIKRDHRPKMGWIKAIQWTTLFRKLNSKNHIVFITKNCIAYINAMPSAELPQNSEFLVKRFNFFLYFTVLVKKIFSRSCQISQMRDVLIESNSSQKFSKFSKRCSQTTGSSIINLFSKLSLPVSLFHGNIRTFIILVLHQLLCSNKTQFFKNEN